MMKKKDNHNYQILAVDDSPDMLELLSRHLQNFGFNVFKRSIDPHSVSSIAGVAGGKNSNETPTSVLISAIF